MIVKVLKNNAKEFDKNLLDYSIQLNALNYLKRNGKIQDQFYNKVKSTIIQNYTLENNL